MSTITAPADIGRATRAEMLRLRKWPAVWITLGSLAGAEPDVRLPVQLPGLHDRRQLVLERGRHKATLLAEMMPANAPNVFLQGMPMFGGALMLVLGAIVAGTATAGAPGRPCSPWVCTRSGAVLGSLSALTVFVVATLVTSFVFDLGLSMLVATTESQDIVMPSLGSVAEAAGAGFLVLGCGRDGFLLGTIARGPALSVGLGLVWALVVENLFRGVGSCSAGSRR